MRESRGEGRRRRFVRSKDQQKERKYFIGTLQFGWGPGGGDERRDSIGGDCCPL